VLRPAPCPQVNAGSRANKYPRANKYKRQLYVKGANTIQPRLSGEQFLNLNSLKLNSLNRVSSNLGLESARRQNGQMADWKFITNHAQVLLCVAHDPEIRLREIAEACGITERAAHRIIADLEEAGYISRERIGRRNRYEFHPEVAMRHPPIGHALVRNIPMGEMVAPLMAPRRSNGAGEAPAGKEAAAGADPQAPAAK